MRRGRESLGEEGMIWKIRETMWEDKGGGEGEERVKVRREMGRNRKRREDDEGRGDGGRGEMEDESRRGGKEVGSRTCWIRW